MRNQNGPAGLDSSPCEHEVITWQYRQHLCTLEAGARGALREEALGLASLDHVVGRHVVPDVRCFAPSTARVAAVQFTEIVQPKLPARALPRPACI